ncbi:MAG: DUF1513 domain-containing protein [Methyloceanibacter sp.]
MRRQTGAIVVFAILCLSSAPPAHAEADHAAIARAALEQYIRPGYAELAKSAVSLKQSVDALCRQPSTAALEGARDGFAATVAAWSQVEPIRFGPVAKEHRYERIFYWPAPKGIGARQVREVMAKHDQSVTGADALAGKSVALQGLPPLEDLLYGGGAEALAKSGGDAAFRCEFAASIAANLARITDEIDRGWQDGAPFVKSYLEPGAGNAAYRNPKEVTLDLFKTFTAGIEIVRDQKLAKILGASAEQARPRLAPFWESGLSFANMAGNLGGVRELFVGSGFAQMVHQESAGVEDSILFDLDHAIEVLRGIDQPIATAARDEAWRQARSLARVAQERGHHRRRHNRAGRRARLRLQCHGWRLTMIGRRELLWGAAGGAALLAFPFRPALARSGAGELFAAARRDDRGSYSAALFSLDDGDVRSVELPARGHDIALRPGSDEWVAFARRPGRVGVAVPGGERPPVWFTAKPDRHFFGHGAFSADGRLLFTTENDYLNAQGMIGVRDATDGYKQIGEFSARGMEPHDAALLADGRTMVIANGGIRTHPDSGADELNLPYMKPSLVYIDVTNGDLLEEQVLAHDLHQLSIRHLALAHEDTVVFGCQYRGPEADEPALLGFHRRGEQPVLVRAPGQTQGALRNYVGSVTADAGGAIVAASAPKGGLITYWDVSARRFLGSCELNDGCGVAPTRHQASFLLTSGRGWLVETDVRGVPDEERRSSPFEWDNHAILVR